MNAPTIHIEGMDLAGKTSARNRLAAQLGGWAVRSNQLCERNVVFAVADRLRRENTLDAASLGHLFVAAVGADLQWYQPASKPLIQDSTVLLRSLAYHRVNQTPGVVEALERFLPKHPRFTISVVLTASLKERCARLRMRRSRAPNEVADDDLMVEQDPNRFLAMERELIDIAVEHFSARVIDTSNLNELEVAWHIMDIFAAHE